MVHEAVTQAGLEPPVMVGHSLAGVIATVYAASHPVAGVVNVDQPLLVGPFGDVLREAEPVLRSPAWEEVWDSMLAGMHIDLLSPAAQDLVRTATTPRQDLLLGYWDEVIALPAEEIREQRTCDLRAIAARGVPYHHVTGNELPPPYRAWLESVVPDVTVTVLPGSGHFPTSPGRASSRRSSPASAPTPGADEQRAGGEVAGPAGGCERAPRGPRHPAPPPYPVAFVNSRGDRHPPIAHR